MAAVLVTGGCGFLGAHLVRSLSEGGDKVRVLDRDPPGKDAPEAEYLQGSILDEATLEGAMRGVERVYHLAACAHLWAPQRRIFEEINHEGTRRVLQAGRTAGAAKIVHVSTEAILGSFRSPREGLIDESAPLPGLDEMAGPYTRSKWHAEQEARRRIEEGWPVVIVYPTTPVGPGDVNLTPPGRLLRGLVAGKVPAYLETQLNWVDARAVAKGIHLAGDRAEAGARYILGGENLALSEVLAILAGALDRGMPTRRVPYTLARASALVSEVIAKATKRAPLATVEGVRLAKAGLQFDSGLACRELSYDPGSTREALVEAAQWHAANAP